MLGRMKSGLEKIGQSLVLRIKWGKHPLMKEELHCGSVARVVATAEKDIPQVVAIFEQSGDFQDQEKSTEIPVYLSCAHMTPVLSWDSQELASISQEISISIPDSVRGICERCFYECKSLVRVTFGPSSCLERIGFEAFSGRFGAACRVAEITIPDSVQELCDRCFYGCKSLVRVTFGSSSCLKRIGAEAFAGNHGVSCRITEISIPDSVREVCCRCFYDCLSLCRVTFGPSSSLEHIGFKWIGKTNITEVAIPDGVRELCDRCFYDCNTLLNVTFGSSSCLEWIGASAFSGSTGNRCSLSEVTILDGVRELGDRCFYGCKSLRYVTFGSSSCLQRIGDEAFLESSVIEMSIPDSVRELGDRCFYECKCLWSVTFGESSSLEHIGTECFARSGLIEFRMPPSVRVVGGGAFDGCDLHDYFVCSDDCHFINVHSLVIDKDLMACCCVFGNLSSITIPDNVRVICDRCFYGCRDLDSVTFGPASCLERIGVEAFADIQASSIAGTICIPDSVRELCDRCFRGWKCLSRVTFGPLSSLERIGTECFARSGLMEFQMPPSVRVVGGGAFGECRMSDSFICGDECHFISVNFLLFDKTMMSCLCGIGAVSDITIPDTVREICDRCFYRCKTLRDVRFGPASCLERIGVKSFQFSGVRDMSIPTSVRELGDKCFKNCSHLWCSFQIPSCLERIGVECMVRTRLREIVIPDSVCELCDRCCYGCMWLSHVRFGKSPSLERIGRQCFAHSAVSQFRMPPSVRSVGGGAFGECRMSDGFICSPECRFITVNSLVIDKNLMACCCSFGVLSSITIPDNVREICDRCFYGCKSLYRVTFGHASCLERIGVEAFRYTMMARSMGTDKRRRRLFMRYYREVGKIRYL